MPPARVLSIDAGTTSVRCLAVAGDATVTAVAQREFAQHYPRPGWVEHDADEIWRQVQATIADVLARPDVDPSAVTGVGITNQRETVVAWNRATGEVLAPAIVWQDRRTAERCAGLRAAGAEEEIRGATGLVCDPYFSGTKIEWLLTEGGVPPGPDLAFGTIDSWLAYKLTGGAVHVTDASNASRTLLFDLAADDWSDAQLARFGVPRSTLPTVVDSSGAVGVTDPGVCAGLAVPVAGMAGDQQSALFGQACHAPGMAKNTYGTGCFMLLNTGAKAVPSKHGLLTTRCAQRGTRPQYALEGGVFIAGAVVQWLRDGLGFFRSSAEIEALAASVEDTGGVYLVPAFAGLGAPHWDAYARGTMLGLTRGTTRAHIARAALEAIAFQSAEVLQAMQKDAGIQLKELRVDGGAAANDTLMQFQADILGVPVLRPKVLETTALGAAYLAGLAAGVWKDTAAIGRQWAVGRRFEPAMPHSVAKARMQGWTRALQRSKGWAGR